MPGGLVLCLPTGKRKKKNNVSIKYSASLLSEISNIKMGANLLPGAMIKMPLFPAK